MKVALIAGILCVLTTVFLADARPSHAGWSMGMCREGYVYEPSRNVCVQKGKKAKRSAAKKKAP